MKYAQPAHINTFALLSYVRSNGGATLTQFNSMVDANVGYEVSIKDLSKTRLDTLLFNDALMTALLNSALYEASLMGYNYHVGLWIDTIDGVDYLFIDVTLTFFDWKRAETVARQTKQVAVFDWTTKTSIYINYEKEAENDFLYSINRQDVLDCIKYRDLKLSKEDVDFICNKVGIDFSVTDELYWFIESTMSAYDLGKKED